MNREIKFRAWDKDRKEYLSAGQILISIEPGSRPKKSNIYLDILKDANKYNERFIIEQCTGLKDKNGKEIYEDDVIELVNEDLEKTKVICEYGTARRNIYSNIVDITGFYFRRLSDDRKTFPIVNNYLGKHDLELFEIIGNIHENPKLLEVKDELEHNS